MRRPTRTPGEPTAVDRRTVDVSLRLADARLTQGIPMDTLARTLGCSVAQLERMETGRSSLSAAALVEWVLALNMDLVVQPRRGWPAVAGTQADTQEARLIDAFQSADTRTRDAVAVMLGLDRPASPPVRLTRPGRPTGPASAARSLRLTLEQIDLLRRSPVPFTGNRVLTALKLADGTITRLAQDTCLRYARVSRIVGGKLRDVPPAYAAEIAAAFGCAPQDLFPGLATTATSTGPAALAAADARVAG